MEYEELAYNRIVLENLMQIAESGKEKQTDEQYMEELHFILKHAAYLCSRISDSEKQSAGVAFTRKGTQIQIESDDGIVAIDYYCKNL